MRYVKAVEANKWDSSNEAQTDKILEWLEINRPGMYGYEDEVLTVQTNHGLHEVGDNQVIILDPERREIEVMNGRAFEVIYDMLVDPDM
jgi:hypothetical protein